MIKSDMIAPCGLDCAICRKALQEENPCMGCCGPDEGKTDFCLNHCKIRRCERLRELGSDFCDVCPLYPCEDVLEKETRYTAAYPLFESPMGNLAYIRKHGMDAFIRKERAEWTCVDCDGVICVHSGICSGCGKAYGDQSKCGG
jgi:hypothetical protein